MGLLPEKKASDFPQPDSTRERGRGSGVDAGFPRRSEASAVAPVPLDAPFGDPLPVPAAAQFRGTEGARVLTERVTWSPGASQGQRQAPAEQIRPTRAPNPAEVPQTRKWTRDAEGRLGGESGWISGVRAHARGTVRTHMVGRVCLKGPGGDPRAPERPASFLSGAGTQVPARPLTPTLRGGEEAWKYCPQGCGCSDLPEFPTVPGEQAAEEGM